MIVQIAGVRQLPRPMIKAIYAGLTLAGRFPVLPQPAFGLDAVQCCVQVGAVHLPDGRAQFEPALPISAPVDLLDKFLGRGGAMAGQNGFEYVLFGDDTVADIGRQGRDMGHVIIIAFARIITSRLWGKGVEAGEGGGISGIKHEGELSRARGLSSDSLSRIWARCS